MELRISTDVGGTFTDLVVMEETGRVNVFKTPTTPENVINGIIEGLRIASQYYNLSLQEFMDKCGFFSHGSTISTNALIEGKTAKVGLICTKGHRDILLFREGGKERPFDWYRDYPEPYVPRYLTIPVSERIDEQGKVVNQLNEDEVRAAINQFKEFEVEVIAVSLLWSFMNPSHELRIAEIIKEEWPNLKYCSLSHIVNPRIREYRRTAATVIDASLKPLVTNYVSTFQSSLEEVGYIKEPYLFTSSGGLISPVDMIQEPNLGIDSGPALAPISGKFYAQQELNKTNVISCDMGGTSFDIGLITDGVITVTNNAQVGHEKLSIPKVDVKTIGAGGGSIAWVDKGGLIRIGPEGAGSEPGPACYMKGGERATVTDANLLLGYLNEDYFLGGRMKISKKLAENAIRKNIAEPLGMGVIDAAYAIWNTATVKMSEAIKEVTVQEGINPKEYVFVAGGGAVGMHILPIVSQLGSRYLIIPKTTAALSAFGGAVADVVREFQRSYLTSTKDFDYETVNTILRELKEEANKFLDKIGIPSNLRKFEFLLEARYPFQEQELSITLRRNIFEDENSVSELVDQFHETHEFVLGSKEPGQYVECMVWKVKATGATSAFTLKNQQMVNSKPTEESIKGVRNAYFKDQGGMTNTTVYNGEKLRTGNKIVGPAIIEEPTTNMVISPGEVLKVTESGNYLVDLIKVNENDLIVSNINQRG